MNEENLNLEMLEELPEETPEELPGQTEDIDLEDEQAVEAVIEVADRPFLTTPLNDYTVTEGLLLVLLIVVVFGKVAKLFSR